MTTKPTPHDIIHGALLSTWENMRDVVVASRIEEALLKEYRFIPVEARFVALPEPEPIQDGIDESHTKEKEFNVVEADWYTSI